MVSNTPEHAYPTSDDEVHESIHMFVKRTVSCQWDLDTLSSMIFCKDLIDLPPKVKDEAVQKIELSNSDLVSIFEASDAFGNETFRVPRQPTIPQGERPLAHYYKGFLNRFGESVEGLMVRAVCMIAGADKEILEQREREHPEFFSRVLDDMDELIKDIKHEHDNYKDVS